MSTQQQIAIEGVKAQAIKKGLRIIADKPENMIFVGTIQGKDVRVSVSVDATGKIERVVL
jgi:hypothetical protein